MLLFKWAKIVREIKRPNPKPPRLCLVWKNACCPRSKAVSVVKPMPSSITLILTKSFWLSMTTITNELSPENLMAFPITLTSTCCRRRKSAFTLVSPGRSLLNIFTLAL
eukprot:Lithocolla_globosa_v1_NODE_552_length_3760_cov_9.338462.p4 type:complete len:109 gc:universal NODE_552_length_3760_cov_9.338462:3257-2931(-)